MAKQTLIWSYFLLVSYLHLLVLSLRTTWVCVCFWAEPSSSSLVTQDIMSTFLPEGEWQFGAGSGIRNVPLPSHTSKKSPVSQMLSSTWPTTGSAAGTSGPEVTDPLALGNSSMMDAMGRRAAVVSLGGLYAPAQVWSPGQCSAVLCCSVLRYATQLSNVQGQASAVISITCLSQTAGWPFEGNQWTVTT